MVESVADYLLNNTSESKYESESAVALPIIYISIKRFVSDSNLKHIKQLVGI